MPREAALDRQQTRRNRVAPPLLARLSLAAAVLGVLALQLTPATAVASPSCSSGTCVASFGYRGSVEEWTVPSGVTSLSFVVRGAGGGGGTEAAQGGSGAKVRATLTVAEREKLEFVVGGGGGHVTAGYGGGGEGGNGEYGGGGGGGGSFVFSEAGALMIAAGGGGGAGGEAAAGGSGGQTGSNGGNTNGTSGQNRENAGKGATQSGPGGPGPNGKKGAGPTSTTAIEGTGGRGGAAEASGGGGGGGYYGGGGGGSWWIWNGDGGGGGGSSIAIGASAVTYETGAGGGGAGSYGSGGSGSIELSFAQPATAVALTSTSASPAVGEAVTYTATVSPVPDGGKVVFKDGGTTISACGEVAVSTSTGKAACEVTYDTPGTHTLSAAYLGSSDTVYPAAESSGTAIVATSSTTTSLASSSASPATGLPVVYTATVSPAPSSGTVAFADDGSTIAGCGAQAVNVSTGKATCEVTYDFPGLHAISAAFSGSSDTSYAASTTASPTPIVATEATTTTLTTASRSQIVGGPVTYTATVSPAPDGGTVEFEDGGVAIAGCEAQAVDSLSGVATCQLTYGTPGTHAIGAVFSGSTDTSYAPSSTSSPATFIVAELTTTSLTSTSAAPALGSPVTLTATVAPIPNGGTVDFQDAGVPIAGCDARAIDPSTGSATCEVSYSSPGVHEVAASFSGSEDLSYVSSSTPWFSEIVATATTTLELGVSSATPAAGEAVTLSAHVSPVPQGGAVDFLDGGASIAGCASAPVSTTTGVATCQITYGQPGAHTITASFSGGEGEGYAASREEAPATLTVRAATGGAGGASGEAPSSDTGAAPLTPTAALGRQRGRTSAASGAMKVTILTSDLATLLARRSLLVKETCDGPGGAVATSATLGLPGLARGLSLATVHVTLTAGQSREVRLALPVALVSAIRRDLAHLRARSLTVVVSAKIGAAARSWTAVATKRVRMS